MDFADPKNTAVFTCASILDGSETIRLVSRDEEDGAWQFLPFSGSSIKSARVVSLGAIIEIDRSVLEVADLTLGWQASRTDLTDKWKRERPKR